MKSEAATKSDGELVRLSLSDSDWYAFIVQRYEQQLLRYIRRISGVSFEDAEDVLQEVFLKAYRNLNDFDQSMKFSSWIYRITHNTVISEHRKRTARVQLVGGESAEQFLALVADDHQNPHAAVNAQFDADLVQRILGKIEPRYAEALMLRYIEEKDYQEISDILQKPPGTVATLLHRAKSQLRDMIKKEGIQL